MSDASLELHPAIAQLVENLSRLTYVESVWLFGSRARRDNHLRSDVDLAIDCPNASATEWHMILDEVDQADTLLPIDCVRLNESDAALKENILKWGQILYSRK